MKTKRLGRIRGETLERIQRVREVNQLPDDTAALNHIVRMAAEAGLLGIDVPGHQDVARAQDALQASGKRAEEHVLSLAWVIIARSMTDPDRQTDLVRLRAACLEIIQGGAEDQGVVEDQDVDQDAGGDHVGEVSV